MRSAASIAVASAIAAFSGPYYSEDDLTLTTTASLSALHLGIIVQKTLGVAYAGVYTTFPAGTVVVNHTNISGQIQYTVDLVPGRTVPAGTYKVGSQFGGDGHGHDYNVDGYTVTSTSGGAVCSTSGKYAP